MQRKPEAWADTPWLAISFIEKLALNTYCIETHLSFTWGVKMETNVREFTGYTS